MSQFIRLNFFIICILNVICHSAEIETHIDLVKEDIPETLHHLPRHVFLALHTKKFSFSKFKINRENFYRAAMCGKVNEIDITPQQIVDILQAHVEQNDETAMQTLHGFRKSRFSNLNIVDSAEAAKLVDRGVKENQFWAYQEKLNHAITAKSVDSEFFPYLIWLANRENCFESKLRQETISKAIELLEKHIKTFADPFLEAEKIKYGRPFFLKAQELQRKKNNNLASRNELIKMKDYFKFAKRFGLFSAYKNLYEEKMPIYHPAKSFKKEERREISHYGPVLTFEKMRHYYFLAGNMGHLPSLVLAGNAFLIDLAKNKDVEIGLRCLKSAAEEGSLEAQKSLGLYFEDLKKYDEALQIYGEISKVSPTGDILAATLYKDRGSFLKAFELYERVIKKNNYYLNEAGECLMKLGRDEEALEYFSRASEVNDTSLCALKNLGLLHEQMGNLSQALTYYQQAIKNDSRKFKSKYIHSLAGIAAEKLGSLALAYDYFTAAAGEKTIGPGKWESTYNLARLELLPFEGHDPNPRLAFKKFKIAAENGYVPAMEALTRQYIVLRMSKEAWFWYRKINVSDAPVASELEDLLKNFSTKSAKTITEIINKPSSQRVNTDVDVKITELSKKEPDLAALTPTISSENEISSITTPDVIDKNDDLEEETYPSFAEYEQQKIDGESLRMQLAEIVRMEAQKLSVASLSSTNQLIWQKIKTHQSVSMNEIIALSNDDLIRSYIAMKSTKSGVTFIITYNGIKETIGTHAKHNKSYKGVDRNFRKGFSDALQVLYGFN